MRTMTANDAKKHFGELLDTARREPVSVQKHGRPVAVMLSAEDYEDLKAGINPAQSGDWLRDNKAALESSNDYVEKHGLPLARHRQF
ncbi:MAG: type II toxin-antitoxin system prevent-host-death family antitoxin [Rhodospirillales bacterium]|nr:type II toxin-antitoxin system prevent-host-death family antitoxin [Rhodospirillales bacterium]